MKEQDLEKVKAEHAEILTRKLDWEKVDNSHAKLVNLTESKWKHEAMQTLKEELEASIKHLKEQKALLIKQADEQINAKVEGLVNLNAYFNELK